jgi:hypothetical protein
VDINTQGLSATLQGYGRTNLGLGTAATSNTGDFVAYRTFGTAANSAIGDFAAASHTHSIANVTGLQTALDGKQASGSYAAATHSHIISDVTGLQTALDGKQASLGFTPYNSTNPNGYITGSYLPLAGGTLSGNLLFSDSGTTKRGIQGTVGANDMWFIGGNATGSNAGFLEISTGDDGQTAGSAEPIFVRQYGPGDPLTGTLFRSASLLDASGNTSFPGTLSASNFSGTHSGSSSGTNTGDQTNISGNAATATTATNFNNGYAYSSGSTVYVDTLESISTTDWLELTYYGGLGVRIGSGTNGSKGLYAGSLYDAGNRVYSAGNPQVNISGNAGTADYATTAGTLSSNATVNGLNFGGVFALTGSGASTSNSTGTRMSESYGVVWNCGNGQTWHHQVINGSSLCGFNASGGNFGNGNYYGSGDVTAYYSDERLKTKLSTITDAIEKIKSLEGFVYIENDLARSLGYTNEKEQAGVSAQKIQAVLPQAVSLAPFDMQGVPETGEIISKTGENYLTVKYDRIVPLLIEGIKEQQTQIESQKSEIDELKDLVQQLINR